MHDSHDIRMLGALADQMLSEYGDAMHEAVQPRSQVAITNTAKASGVAPKGAKTTSATATTRVKAKKKPTGLLAWLFGI